MDQFAYDKPRTMDALKARLSEADPGLAILAGGTDLLTQIRSRLRRPSLVLDLKGVPELRALEIRDGGLSIGAAVIVNRIVEEQAVTSPFAALCQAAAELASYPIRNRATVVGNVSNASPCADSVPPLCVFGARVVLDGPAGCREVPVHEFIVGNRETRLGPGEIVTRIHVPTPGPGAFSGFLKRKRVSGHDLALANAALLCDPTRGLLRLSVGSCTPRPTLLVLDHSLDRPDPDEAAAQAQTMIHPINDVRASVEYRRDMVGLMVRRLFEMLAKARECRH